MYTDGLFFPKDGRRPNNPAQSFHCVGFLEGLDGGGNGINLKDIYTQSHGVFNSAVKGRWNVLRNAKWIKTKFLIIFLLLLFFGQF